MNKLPSYTGPLLTRPGIRSLINTLKKQRAELQPYFGEVTENAEQRYCDAVIRRLEECRTLRLETYATLLEDAFFEMNGKLLHCVDRQETKERMHDFTIEKSFPNYVRFLQEYDLATVTLPENELVMNLREFPQNKEKADSGFINFMQREKGAEGAEMAKREISLFTTHLQIGAMHSRAMELQGNFTREAAQTLGNLPGFR